MRCLFDYVEGDGDVDFDKIDASAEVRIFEQLMKDTISLETNIPLLDSLFIRAKIKYMVCRRAIPSNNTVRVLSQTSFLPQPTPTCQYHGPWKQNRKALFCIAKYYPDAIRCPTVFNAHADSGASLDVHSDDLHTSSDLAIHLFCCRVIEWSKIEVNAYNTDFMNTLLHRLFTRSYVDETTTTSGSWEEFTLRDLPAWVWETHAFDMLIVTDISHQRRIAILKSIASDSYSPHGHHMPRAAVTWALSTGALIDLPHLSLWLPTSDFEAWCVAQDLSPVLKYMSTDQLNYYLEHTHRMATPQQVDALIMVEGRDIDRLWSRVQAPIFLRYYKTWATFRMRDSLPFRGEFDLVNHPSSLYYHEPIKPWSVSSHSVDLSNDTEIRNPQDMHPAHTIVLRFLQYWHGLGHAGVPELWLDVIVFWATLAIPVYFYGCYMEMPLYPTLPLEALQTTLRTFPCLLPLFRDEHSVDLLRRGTTSNFWTLLFDKGGLYAAYNPDLGKQMGIPDVLFEPDAMSEYIMRFPHEAHAILDVFSMYNKRVGSKYIEHWFLAGIDLPLKYTTTIHDAAILLSLDRPLGRRIKHLKYSSSSAARFISHVKMHPSDLFYVNKHALQDLSLHIDISVHLSPLVPVMAAKDFDSLRVFLYRYTQLTTATFRFFFTPAFPAHSVLYQAFPASWVEHDDFVTVEAYVVEKSLYSRWAPETMLALVQRLTTSCRLQQILDAWYKPLAGRIYLSPRAVLLDKDETLRIHLNIRKDAERLLYIYLALLKEPGLLPVLKEREEARRLQLQAPFFLTPYVVDALCISNV